MEVKKKTNSRLREAIKLFGIFFRIGLFTFGGGYAMIPLMHREIVEKHKYINDDEMLEMIAIAESTPGPIAINTATFVGTKTVGFIGAAAATFGVVLPSFVIILIVSAFLEKIETYKAVEFAFWGIRAGVLALIIRGLQTMYKKCPKNIFSYIIMALSFVAVAVFGVNTLIVIASSAFLGLACALIAKRGREK